jgi:hypothetical protein
MINWKKCELKDQYHYRGNPVKFIPIQIPSPSSRLPQPRYSRGIFQKLPGPRGNTAGTRGITAVGTTVSLSSKTICFYKLLKFKLCFKKMSAFS